MLARRIISRETVITKLKESIEDMIIISMIILIMNYIKKLELEFDTSYKEYQYGDNNKYSHLVYNDLVEVVKKVIDAL